MKSVSSRLLFIMLVITVAGMGLTTAIGTVMAGRSIYDQTYGRVSEATARNAGNINSWIEEQIRYVDAIAADYSTREDVSPDALLPSLIRHTDTNEDYFAVYVGYPNGVGVFNDEWEPDYSEWLAYERPWYKGAAANPSKTYIDDLYMDAETKEIVITFSRVFHHNGAMAGVIAIDIFTTVLDRIVKEASVGEGSYAFMTDANGNVLAHPNEAFAPTIDANDDIVFAKVSQPDKQYYYEESGIPSVGWNLHMAIPKTVVNAPINQQIIAAVIGFIAVLFCITVLIIVSLRRLIVRPVKDVTEAANLLARGESGVRLEGRYIGEIAQLADSFRHMETFNRQQMEWLEGIAQGDLTIQVRPRGPGDRTGHAIADMLKHLNDMFLNINHSARHVAAGSGQIAEGAQHLAKGTLEQNETIQDLSEAIGDLAEKTKGNAQKAGRAAELSESIFQNARKGTGQMDNMMSAVKEISESSHKVNRVIKAIDDIAFQTNILALNAAVEAARAGQHGKGFAVVAEEVRSLAGKSAEAAKETGGLINDSIGKADLGARIAEETAASLTQIVEGINENTRIIEEIAKSSEIQAGEIEQVNRGIAQVVEVIRQNSATAEQSASASREMSDESELLIEQVLRFKLSEDESSRKMLGGR
ncbi:MAG: methyl-accepting chemotaxis protein [Oscillospiraceae bacterium]|nr:methyl-accepting chemotaxis protein [Oscillospiraceae bacterium]